jgi:hypothetical protein
VQQTKRTQYRNVTLLDIAVTQKTFAYQQTDVAVINDSIIILPQQCGFP